VLERGYAMVHAGPTLVREASQVAAGVQLRVRVARGSLDVTVDRVEVE
jgi:exonuclease VII large subunit